MYQHSSYGFGQLPGRVSPSVQKMVLDAAFNPALASFKLPATAPPAVVDGSGSGLTLEQELMLLDQGGGAPPMVEPPDWTMRAIGAAGGLALGLGVAWAVWSK